MYTPFFFSRLYVITLLRSPFSRPAVTTVVINNIGFTAFPPNPHYTTHTHTHTLKTHSDTLNYYLRCSKEESIQNGLVLEKSRSRTP